MAATLVEGQKYGLNSKDSTSGNKTVIHFKLTDSALRALEEFSKIKGCSRKPTVQFSGQRGVMSIPGQVSSDDPKAERRYGLNLSKSNVDANGSFDCVQQTKSRYGSSLSYQGGMQYKVTTNANSEAYSDTLKKIAYVDNESKKLCAKEIKMSGGRVSKKIKKVIPSSQFKALPPSRHAPSSLSALSSSLQPQSSTSSGIHLSTSASNGLSSTKASSSSSLVTSNNGVIFFSNANSANTQPSRAYTFPIRDRVVQLLALRSYKKPELVYRLMKDGIHKDDRNSLDTVLKSIAVTNKDMIYTLHKDAWQYFRADWALYSETDKQLARRNQQQAESRASVSPLSVSPAVRPSPSPPQKRGASDDPTERISSKKQRISHQDEPPASRPNGKLTNGSLHNGSLHNGSMPNGSMPSGALPLFGKNNYHPHNPHNHRTSTGSTGSLSTSSESSVDSVGTLPSGTSDKDSPSPESPSFTCENLGKGDDENSSTPDYMSRYSQITTFDQRRSYAEDFNQDFKEYKELFEKVEDISRLFDHFKERISSMEEGSQRYKEMKQRVVAKYNLQKSNVQYMSRKRRVDYLHDKLTHIKGLIIDYESRDYHLSLGS
ncbi:hypothetical protein ACOMHN_001186 [Nucella lapillus]